jgi:hypothetical protein
LEVALTVKGVRPPRILCLSPLFPPLANAEAFVGGKMVLALRELGCDVRVLYDGGFPARENMPIDSSPAWDALRTVSEGLVAPARGRVRKLAETMRYLALDGWVVEAVRRARELARERPFDLVYSRSVPKRAHVAGFWCARALGVPWAVGINDPWAFYYATEWEGAPVPRGRRLLSEMWLRRTLRAADVVTFPSRRLATFTARIAGWATCSRTSDGRGPKPRGQRAFIWCTPGTWTSASARRGRCWKGCAYS